MFDSTFGGRFAIVEKLVEAAPLLLTGLSVAIAFSLLVFNVGAEGQLYIGAIAAASVALVLGDHLPSAVIVPLVVIAGDVGRAGAYASVGDKVLERAAGHACSAYRVPNVDIEARAVYTINPPAGAMRGFGANQASFGIESMMDMLAEKVGIDGWEMRWRNALDVGDVFGTGQVLGPASA